MMSAPSYPSLSHPRSFLQLGYLECSIKADGWAEPSLPPGLASSLCQCSRDMSQCCSHLALDVTQAPGAPCTHCPTPSECPGQLGARSVSVSPEVLGFIHPIPSHLISLSPEASCSASPGSWPLPSASAPTLRRPLLGAAIAVPCHREEMEQAEGAHHPSRHLQHPGRGSSYTCSAQSTQLAL